MAEWKRPLLIGIGWGVGTAAGLALILGGLLWYESRPKPPKPPKPWDTSAIRAEYDFAGTEGDDNTIVIRYTLENTTEFDYKAQEGEAIMLSGKLEEEKSLLPVTNLLKIDYPIVVPAKKRVAIKIHIDYRYPEKAKQNADEQEKKKYRGRVAKYIATEMSNLDGFDLLDETNRYEIVFPAGWKHD